MSAFNLCEQKGYLMETLDVWAGLHPSLVTIPVEWKYKIPFGILYAQKPAESVAVFVDTIAKATSSGGLPLAHNAKPMGLLQRQTED